MPSRMNTTLAASRSKRGHDQLVERGYRQGRVVGEGDELAGQHGAVPAGLELLAEAVGLDLGQTFPYRVERAELVSSLSAVLSPTPGTPGMLSDASPVSDR